MTVKRILAGMLTVCALLSCTCPVFAREANAYNVLFGAMISYVGLSDPDYSGDIYQDIRNLVDNDWAIGPESKYGNYHARITNGKERYNADGKLTNNGPYAGIITFELEAPARAAGFRLIHPDVTGASGVKDPRDFLLSDFEVLGSESGEPGTWKVLYEARSLRNGNDVEYGIYDSDYADGIPVYAFEDKFSEEMQVSYIALAIHGLNVEGKTYGIWMNIHEFQVFTPARYEIQQVEDTTPVTTAPVREPLSVEDFIPQSPWAMVAVSAALATVCSVGCLFWNRKKEKSSS